MSNAVDPSANKPTAPKSVLFVDDDAMVLETLECMFEAQRGEWDLRFAGGGTQALEMMGKYAADVVVSDMRMPKMNGAELLNEIMRQYPKTVRFILSGYADMEMVMRCVGGTHQFLSKPCDVATLQATVRRAIEMDRWLNNDEVKTLVSRVTTLPSLPELYFQILEELRSPEGTLEKVGATIAKDPAMTAKMLQLVNSAFFGVSYQVTSPTEAVMQLGMETIKSLALAIHIFSELDSASARKLHVEKVHHHCLATGTKAKRIARLERQDKRILDEAFTAGLLHDVGRLVLIANLPAEYAEAVRRSEAEKLPLLDAERAVFGVSHAEVGGYLLGLWGLPIAIAEAAVFHHSPRLCQSGTFTSLTAVHAANVFEQGQAGSQPPGMRPELDQEYLVKAGVWDRVPAWRADSA